MERGPCATCHFRTQCGQHPAMCVCADERKEGNMSRARQRPARTLLYAFGGKSVDVALANESSTACEETANAGKTGLQAKIAADGGSPERPAATRAPFPVCGSKKGVIST